MTEHHPMSRAARRLVRAIRHHEAEQSASSAEGMVAALRTVASTYSTTEAEVLAAAAEHLSIRRIAEVSGYQSHTHMRRKLGRIRRADPDIDPAGPCDYDKRPPENE